MEYWIQIKETHVHNITNVPVVLYGAGRNDFDAGKSITRAIGIKIITFHAI